jgi:hypothetical protein
VLAIIELYTKLLILCASFVCIACVIVVRRTGRHQDKGIGLLALERTFVVGGSSFSPEAETTDSDTGVFLCSNHRATRFCSLKASCWPLHRSSTMTTKTGLTHTPFKSRLAWRTVDKDTAAGIVTLWLVMERWLRLMPWATRSGNSAADQG